jgi:hypothetical protein
MKQQGLLPPRPPRRRESLGSGRRFKGLPRRGRSRRAALDVVAASWTIRAEEDGLTAYQPARPWAGLILRLGLWVWPGVRRAARPQGRARR